VLRPVGPLPPGAYWLRRLFVLALILILVGVAWWLLNRGSSDDVPAAATPTVSSSTPTPSVTPTKKPKPTKSTPTPSPTVPVCSDKDVEVTVTTDAESYSTNELPTFTLAVENVSEDACSRDVGAPALELRVSSGGSKVWSSDDCNPGGDSKQKVLDPGDRFGQSVQWERVISQQGCPTPQETAAPGSYQVLARNLDVFSDPVPFVLQ